MYVTPIPGSVEQIRERHVRRRIVQPVRERIDKQPPCARRASRRGPHLPVALGVGVPAVQRDPELLADLWVPAALHVVQGLVDDAEVEEFVEVGVVEQAPGGAELVGEHGVAHARVDGVECPLLVVVGCRGGVFCGAGGVAD